MISYAGIEEAVLVHALYHELPRPADDTEEAQWDRPDLTVDMVRTDMTYIPEDYKRNHGYQYQGYCGRPLRLQLDVNMKTFDPIEYDLAVGVSGTAAAVVARLKKESKSK